MTVKRVRTVYHSADDVGRTAAFYMEALELPLKFRDGDSWIEFRTGDASFALGSLSETSNHRHGAVVVFEVDELEALIERIQSKGGRLESQRDMGDHGKVATCIDPDGNFFHLLLKPLHS